MRTILLVLAIGVLLAPATEGAIYVIAPDGSGDFATIDDCVIACGNGDTVELTDGTFTGAGNVNILDTASALMAVPTLVSSLLLSPAVVRATSDSTQRQDAY